jgi:hypothetical protein
MVEDIGKLAYFTAIIEGQKRVVRFIMNHHYSLGLFRQFAEKELLRTGAGPLISTRLQSACKHAGCGQGLTAVVLSAAETRFYGAHIVAERVLELKAPLMQTVVSQEWSDWVKRSSAKITDEAKVVKALLLDEKDFWTKLEIMTEVFQPIVDLLRLTDSMVPAASKVCSYYLLAYFA